MSHGYERPAQTMLTGTAEHGGSQFCKGFGGIGALLRYAVDVTEFEAPEDVYGDMWDEDDW